MCKRFKMMFFSVFLLCVLYLACGQAYASELTDEELKAWSDLGYTYMGIDDDGIYRFSNMPFNTYILQSDLSLVDTGYSHANLRYLDNTSNNLYELDVYEDDEDGASTYFSIPVTGKPLDFYLYWCDLDYIIDKDVDLNSVLPVMTSTLKGRRGVTNPSVSYTDYDFSVKNQYSKFKYDSISFGNITANNDSISFVNVDEPVVNSGYVTSDVFFRRGIIKAGTLLKYRINLYYSVRSEYADPKYISFESKNYLYGSKELYDEMYNSWQSGLLEDIDDKLSVTNDKLDSLNKTMQDNQKQTNEKLDKVDQSIKDQTVQQKQQHEETKGLLGKIIQGITDLPELIGNVLKGLFIPEDGWVEGKFQELQDKFSDSLGIIAYPFEVVIDFFSLFDIPDEEYTFEFPALKVGDHQILAAQSFKISDYVGDEFMAIVDQARSLFQILVGFALLVHCVSVFSSILHIPEDSDFLGELLKS